LGGVGRAGDGDENKPKANPAERADGGWRMVRLLSQKPEARSTKHRNTQGQYAVLAAGQRRVLRFAFWHVAGLWSLVAWLLAS
jgi:hypothetical protein